MHSPSIFLEVYHANWKMSDRNVYLFIASAEIKWNCIMYDEKHVGSAFASAYSLTLTFYCVYQICGVTSSSCYRNVTRFWHCFPLNKMPVIRKLIPFFLFNPNHQIAGAVARFFLSFCDYRIKQNKKLLKKKCACEFMVPEKLWVRLHTNTFDLIQNEVYRTKRALVSWGTLQNEYFVRMNVYPFYRTK